MYWSTAFSCRGRAGFWVLWPHLGREHLGRADSIEIVLIGSDSLDTVKVTHANYRDGTVAVSKYFAGI
jgi:hypothetical protein